MNFLFVVLRIDDFRKNDELKTGITTVFASAFSGGVSGALPVKAEILMEFEEYLRLKKIDPMQFRSAEPGRYVEWEQLFAQLSPDSFTTQKKYLLNNTRRLYLLR